MKCCTFGTKRIDIRSYNEFPQFKNHNEIKINEMNINVGGSVYNTTAFLNEMKHDAVMYTLNAVDGFADFIKTKTKQSGIRFVVSEKDTNVTAVSLIFIDDTGNKKTMSYDGERQDRYVLEKLKKEISFYDLFYTSFYEINSENYLAVAEILEKSKMNFIDLSPLIYLLEKNVIEKTLEKTHLLSGTDDEFETLLLKTDCGSIASLMQKYGIETVFVKKGSQGAEMFTGENHYEYAPKEKRASRDTTGCGDTFNAGVIDSLINNEYGEKMLEKAVELATVVAYDGFDPKLNWAEFNR